MAPAAGSRYDGLTVGRGNRAMLPSAFEQGKADFLNDRVCPFDADSADYADWWRGWQASAEAYLNDTFKREWKLTDDA